MMVTNGGQLVRCPVRNIRIVSRSSRGVTVIRVKDSERLVSVERIEENEDEDTNGEAGGETGGEAGNTPPNPAPDPSPDPSDS